MQTGVKSADRVIDVLEIFKENKTPLSLKAIRETLGYPQSSMTTLLKTLVMRGYLNYDRRNRVYFPTMMVCDLGSWLPKALFGNDRVLECLRDAHSTTGETVVLATLNDVFVQYLQVIESRHEFRFVTTAGMLKPVTHSSVGWLLLTTFKHRDAETIVRRSNIAMGKPAGENLETICENIAQARKEGFGYAENMPYDGGGTVCVMLPTKIFGLPLALACGGSVDRIRKNKAPYLKHLRQCAATIVDIQSHQKSIDIEF